MELGALVVRQSRERERDREEVGQFLAACERASFHERHLLGWS